MASQNTAILGLATKAAKDFKKDNAQQFAAALAFFTVLSLAPLLVVAIGLSGIFFAEEAARGEIVQEVGQFVGDDAGEAIQSMVKNASEGEGGAWASIVGLIALAWGASKIFTQLRIALNEILKVAPKEDGGIAQWIRLRLVAIAGVISVGAAILVSVLLNTILSRLQGQIDLPGSRFLWQFLSMALSLAMLGAVITLVFRFIPDERLPWKTAGVGALVTTALFTIGQGVITLYFTYSDIGSSFGASSSLIILILWIYYSASMLFFGAEVMQVWSGEQIGRRSIPQQTEEPSAPLSSEPSRESGGGAGAIKMTAAVGAGGCLGIFGGILTALLATIWFVIRNAMKLIGR